MRIVLYGATGMIGAGVLLECVDSPEIESVLVVGRSPCGVSHAKVREVILEDVAAIHTIRDMLRGLDASFFCLGLSSIGLSETEYRRLTHDLTLTVARETFSAAPASVFIYVSGAGTDSSEKGRAMWARVKGATENDLLKIGFRSAYMFRPGFIQPVRGVRSRTGWYQKFYDVLRPISPFLRRALPNFATTTSDLGRAMIRVARNGYPVPVLESRDINSAAGQ